MIRRSAYLHKSLLCLCMVLNSVCLYGISIDSLIARMSLEEKVGQMTQIDLGVIAKGAVCNLSSPQQIDTAKLIEAIQKYSIGSVLNVGCGSGAITVERWRSIIRSIHHTNTLRSRLTIPIIYAVDAVHGANYTLGATLFPQPIGQAATWNPELVRRLNEVTAYEVRASGIPMDFSPVLDIGRQPLWSRFFETFGEDVKLASEMGRSAIKGLQGDHAGDAYHVAACMKHFLGYGFPLSGHDRTPAWISDRELREYFLPTFQAAIKEGALSLMVNSGEINGTPVHANRDILTVLLRQELGFTGVVITDWEDIYKLVNVHHIAKDKREAVKIAVMAGIDVSMTPNDFEFNDLLTDLVRSGEIPVARIDSSVRRVLQLKQSLGLFENTVYQDSLYGAFGSSASVQLNYQVASESVTLLKNERKVLPLIPSAEKILVCGPSANSMNLLNGGWTDTWQGVDTAYDHQGKKTIFEALHTSANVFYSPGVSVDSILDTAACMNLARRADKIVVCLGEKPCTEIPGNIDDLDLTASQRLLVSSILTLRKPVVLVCCFNRPRIIHSFVDKVDAIVYAYLPGDEGGRAIADILTGVVNPSGRLPFTYPSASNALVHYDHKAAEEIDTDFSSNGYRPDFDFGFGMSYSAIVYTGMQLSSAVMKDRETVEVIVTLKNNSGRDAYEAVQLYYRDMVASITPSVKKLVAFEKVNLKPGEERTVRFPLKKSDLSFINKELQRITEPGEFQLMVSDKKALLHVE